MSSTNPAPGRGDPIARDVRPLPSAPSLEYERKEAKALLKQIRAGDADALHRVSGRIPPRFAIANPASCSSPTPST